MDSVEYSNQSPPQALTGRMLAEEDIIGDHGELKGVKSSVDNHRRGSPAFSFEELPDDYDNANDAGIEIIHADSIEESSDDNVPISPESDSAAESEAGVTRRLRRMHCNDSTTPEYRSRDQVKRKWNAGLYKRTHSQSAEDEEKEDSQVESPIRRKAPMRRMRRRIGSPTESDWVEEFSDGSVYSVPASRAGSVLREDGHAGKARVETATEEAMDVDA